jgi:transcriptional regulator with XRE-family HTH domain
MRSDERVAHQVGSALRRVRVARGLRQKVVARLAGIPQPTLSMYERGHKCPVLPNLVLLLRVLGCSAEEFGKHVGPWGCLDTPPGPQAA